MKQIPVCSLEETGELGLKLASLIKPGIIPRLGRPLKSKCYVVAYVGRIQFGFR